VSDANEHARHGDGPGPNAPAAGGERAIAAAEAGPWTSAEAPSVCPAGSAASKEGRQGMGKEGTASDDQEQAIPVVL
jgi:hypothetical protein